jgi:hypothetical protein
MEERVCVFDAWIVRYLSQVHPQDFSSLRARFLHVLVSITGIDPSHPAFAALRDVRDQQEFARVRWQELAAQIGGNTCLTWTVCAVIVEHVRIFALRAVQHQRLYLSRSSSTLQALGWWPIPPGGDRPELMQLCDAFRQAWMEADRVLQAGRACLQEFERLALRGEALARLPALLNQAAVCYTDYCQALERGDELAYYIQWYLAWESDEVRVPGWFPSHAA